MRDLWRIMEALTKQKVLVTFKCLPSSHYYFSVYGDGTEHMYDGKDLNVIEKQVMADWGHLIYAKNPVVRMPLPAGFPLP